MKPGLKPLILTACLLLTLAELAFAVSKEIAWDTPPPTEDVSRWDIYKINPATQRGEWYGWSSETSFSMDLAPGTYQFAVIASNSHGYGPPSESLTFFVPESPPPVPDWTLSPEGILTVNRAGVRIKISPVFSTDLIHWTDKPSPSARFTRIKAESP